MKKSNPIRMCITCRKRESQKKMIRFQATNDGIVLYKGFGRSMYMCRECSVTKRRVKALQKRFRLDNGALDSILKEL